MKTHTIMKKIYFLALAALVLPSTYGCTKKYYTEEITYVEGVNLQSADFSIKNEEWQLDQNSGFYSVQLNVPQITKEVVDNGTIQVLRKFEGDVWTPLPIVRAEVTDAEGGGDYYFSTYIDYEWSVGKVFIFVTATDFYTGDTPGDMYFRVNIIK